MDIAKKRQGGKKALTLEPGVVFCTYKSIHRIIVPFAAALRGGGIKGTRWESGAYPVAVFAAARLCAERRPLWAGAHEKVGSRAGRGFYFYGLRPAA